MEETVISEADLRDLARRALAGAGAAEWVARALARTIAAEGAAGLARLPGCCAALAEGRVDGQAVPVVERPAAGVVAVDAAGGFAEPAIEAGFGELIPLVRRAGVAALSITRAKGEPGPGVHLRWLAEEGLSARPDGAALVVADPALVPGAEVPEAPPPGGEAAVSEDLRKALRRWL